LVFPLYFIVLTISLFYTTHLHDGVDLVIRSLSLLLFPVLFLFVKEDASSVRKLIEFLLYGLVFYFVVNLFTVSADVITRVNEIITRADSSLKDQITIEWNILINDQF